MANEVANVFGGKVGMVNTEALKQSMAQSAALDPRGGGADGSDFMNFSGKHGNYQIGKDKRDTNKEELWLVNAASFEDGWICWKGGKPVATRLYAIGQPVPQPNMEEFSPFNTKAGDGWFQAKAMTVKSFDHDQQAYFKINSVSGVSVFAELQKEITQRIMVGQPFWPVISFDRATFEAQGMKNFKPVITIDGWLSTQQVSTVLPPIFSDENASLDLEALYEAADTDAAIPAPTDRETDEAVTAEDVPEAEQKPVARRRRAAL